jgi:hypothetical protein
MMRIGFTAPRSIIVPFLIGAMPARSLAVGHQVWGLTNCGVRGTFSLIIRIAETPILRFTGACDRWMGTELKAI